MLALKLVFGSLAMVAAFLVLALLLTIIVRLTDFINQEFFENNHEYWSIAIAVSLLFAWPVMAYYLGNWWIG